MIMGLAHVCFIVADLERAVAFYRDKLGFEPAFDFVNAQGAEFGQYLHAGRGTFVELFQGELKPVAEGQSYRHLCLQVDDIQATSAELRRRGVEVSEVKKGTDNSWQAWLADADGNRIELHQYTPESKQGPWVR